VVQAFYDGLAHLTRTDWEYLVKLDGDLGLPATYFEYCLRKFCELPLLGVGGGTVYHLHKGIEKVDRSPEFHVRGATKIYRRDCWDSIGGLLQAPGWDTLDEVKANMLGWQTLTFRDVRIVQYKPTGSAEGFWRDAVKNGLANYISGYDPLFMLLKCVKRLIEEPYVVYAAGLLYGFVLGYVKHTPKVQDEVLIRYLRRQQWRRLLLLNNM
jgi:hypothetical protein